MSAQFAQPASTTRRVPVRNARATGLAVTLAVLVVAVRLALARKLTFCGTPDACYYLGMAQNLGAGRGFHARFLYDLQQSNPTLPNTGIEYWRPGISLLLLLLKPFGGISLYGSVVLTTLVGVLFAAAAWHIAVRSTGDRRLALGSFALCLLSPYTWIGSATPDSSLYYGAAVGWFLALFTVKRQGLWADLLALGCAGLAYLIRNDAALLLVPLLTVLWARRGTDRSAGSSGAYALAMIAGFFAVLMPMHLIYREVLGTAFPSGTARVFFLDSLSDFEHYRDPVSLHSLLGHGIKHLIVFRVATLATVLYRIAVLMIGLPALVFVPGLLRRDAGPQVGAATDPRLPEMAGNISFALAMLLLYTLVLPAIGGFSALRSAVALMPLVSVVLMVAVLRSARTPRLAHWLMTAVAGAYAVSGIMEAKRDLIAANTIGAADRDEAALLAGMGAQPSSAVVLTGDPVQFSVTTGYATVALPSNGLDALVAAARDFRATHVILDSGNLPASPAEIKRRLHPVRSAALEPEHLLLLELPQTAPAP